MIDVAVLLIGARASITGGALTLLANNDVIVLNLDWRGVANMVGYGWIDNSRVAARHRCQAELSLPRRKSSWRAIVRAKISGQANNLAHFQSDSAATLRRLGREVRSGDPDNYEAQAARLYWPGMFSDRSFARSPEFADNTNSMLNYGYAILRGFVIQGVSLAGLWPTLGIWHRNRSNSFCLADDLIEPFRPAIDATVRELPIDASLEQRHVKHELVSCLSRPMGTNGETVTTCIYNLAQSLAMFVEGDVKSLDVPIWQPS